MPAPRDLDWTRDELILALDLALRYPHTALTASDPTVLRLSRELCALRIHPEEDRLPSFRSPDSVAMRLAEFRGAGRGESALSAAVRAEFGGNLSKARAAAREVRSRHA